jgi:hypothetical protein
MIFLSTESDSLGITSCLPVIRPESKAKGQDHFLLADLSLPIVIATWRSSGLWSICLR